MNNNDDFELQIYDDVQPGTGAVGHGDQRTPRQLVTVVDSIVVDGGEARSALPGHDDGLRPGAAGHGQDAETGAEMRQAEPNDWSRPDAAKVAADDGANAAGREHFVSGHLVSKHEVSNVENGAGDDEARLGVTSHDEVTSPDPEPDVLEPASDKIESVAEANYDDSDAGNKAAPEAVPPVAPPASPTKSADLVTVEEAVAIFTQRGLPRHMRTIQKYCSRKSGRALVCYQVPTENGIRYMIERSSIDRFIGDAAQQAPTGKLEQEPVAAQPSEREAAPMAVADATGIFEHPFVQRLEAQVERLESRNEHLQREIQNVLTDANERLVELQKANAVAQSESLGTFLLEAERIRRRQDAATSDFGDAPAAAASPLGTSPPVNREGRQFGPFDV